MKAPQDKDLQYAIGQLLRFGVLVAMAIVCIGCLSYLIHHAEESTHYATFNAHAVDNAQQWWLNLKQLKSEAIINLGIIALMLLPILRVICSLIGFWLEKDYLYVVIASIVLCIIAISLIFSLAAH
jgi:uncharacterized membrane protein